MGLVQIVVEVSGIIGGLPNIRLSMIMVGVVAAFCETIRGGYTREKNPFATTRTVLKNHLTIGRNFERCSYHADLSKICPSHQRPVSIEFLTICRIPGFPNLIKIEKVAETIWTQLAVNVNLA